MIVISCMEAIFANQYHRIIRSVCVPMLSFIAQWVKTNRQMMVKRTLEKDHFVWMEILLEKTKNIKNNG